MSRFEVHRRAAALLDLRRPHEAEALLRRHIEGEPEDVEALLMLSDALADQGHDLGAVSAARAAVRLEPDSSRVHQRLANALIGTGDAAGAEMAARQVVRLAPQAWNGYYTLARALLLGQDARPRAALHEAVRAVNLAPHSADAHNLVGVCFDRLQEHERARAAFEESLRLDPTQLHAQANLAALDAEHGKLRRSARRLTAALGNHPQEEALHSTVDAVLARFARRLWFLVLAGAVVVGIELGVAAPWWVRSLTGVVICAVVWLLIRWFLGHLPRGLRSFAALRGVARGWTRRGLLLLAVSALALVLMSWAPYDAAVVAGVALLAVLRLAGLLFIIGAVVGAVINLFRGK